MGDKTLIVTGANHDYQGAPVSVKLDAPANFASVQLIDTTTGHSVPCQWRESGTGIELCWIEYSLEKGATKKYEVTFSDAAPVTSGVEIQDNGDNKLDVLVRGEFFTSYWFGPEWHRPYFHPMIGPYGDSVTRAYPMVKDVPGETQDHPHHKGVYVAYGEVNGVNNWSDGKDCGYTLHREFSVLQNGPVYGQIVALGDWVTPDKEKVLLHEERSMRIYNIGPSRLVDYDIVLTAADEDVLFEDTKEGGILSLRVTSSMDVPRGGRLENAVGGLNENEVWGKRAHWCDYSGPVNQKNVGVAYFDHNKNFRHPTYWHARNYGLMTANPFGLSYFEGAGYNGDYTLPAGEALTFRYRIYVHTGDAAEGKVAEKYHNYIHPPKVKNGN